MELVRAAEPEGARGRSLSGGLAVFEVQLGLPLLPFPDPCDPSSRIFLATREAEQDRPIAGKITGEKNPLSFLVGSPDE